MEKPKIFISYSHKDTAWKDRLVPYLGVLQRQGLLNFWTDDDIGIGEEWFPEIEAAINTATAAILLVSVDFLNSPFIEREEIGRVLKLRKENGFPIYPILVRQCPWKRVPWLAQLQMRPRGGKPLAAGTEHDIDEHLTAIVEEIDGMLGRLTKTSASLAQGKEKPKSQRESTAILGIQEKETALPDLQVSHVAKEEPPRIEVVSPPVPPPAPAPVAPFTEITNSIGMKLILIPAGEFVMGSETGESDEQPVRLVRITQSFYLGKYPVTQAQWRAVMGNNPSSFQQIQQREGWIFSKKKDSKKKDNLEHPVECVSWTEAKEFLSELSVREGQKFYRLPTEAEWEYACRAGSTGAYCFGDSSARLGEYAWYRENAGGRTHPVGQLRPNAWGLHDMHGNVWEWVQDWYAEDYYGRRPNPDMDPPGPELGDLRVLRGGSWDDVARYVRVALRNWYGPDGRLDNFGFRCVQ